MIMPIPSTGLVLNSTFAAANISSIVMATMIEKRVCKVMS